MLDKKYVLAQNNKFYIYGTDNITKKIVTSVFNGPKELYECGCIGFIGTDPYEKHFLSLPVYTMNNIPCLLYFKICIATAEDFNIEKDHLLIGYGLRSENIKSANWLIQLKILQKYRNSEKKEINVVINNLLGCEDSDDFCGFCKEKPRLYKINWDPEFDMPYAIYEGKRIYYPRNHRFKIKDEMQYVEGIEYEQQKGSPHEYITNKVKVNRNSVIVDAGTCEGNFSIKYVDDCKKLFLIEPDPDWEYPLQLTFRNYMNKVIFCKKYLSNVNDDTQITLDKLLKNEKVDFIKMDIEGFEVGALLGAKDTFLNNNISCSICSYHKHGDERKIKKILEMYGYSFDTSNGYMIFMHDRDRFKYCELRRGIVYGWKE